MKTCLSCLSCLAFFLAAAARLDAQTYLPPEVLVESHVFSYSDSANGVDVYYDAENETYRYVKGFNTGTNGCYEVAVDLNGTGRFYLVGNPSSGFTQQPAQVVSDVIEVIEHRGVTWTSDSGTATYGPSQDTNGANYGEYTQLSATRVFHSGDLTFTMDSYSGRPTELSGNFTGYYNGTFYINETVPISLDGPITLFGTAYSPTSASDSNSHSLDEYNNIVTTTVTSRVYESAEQQSVTVTYDSSGETISGNDVRVGSFSRGYDSEGNQVWSPFESALFAPMTFALNGELFTFSSGLTTDGQSITETYTSASGLEVIIQGVPGHVWRPDAPVNATVILRPSGGTQLATGTCDKDQKISLTGYVMTDPASTFTTPYFLDGTLSTVWVDGLPYAFEAGYAGNSGERVDVFVNQASCRLSLIGTASDDASLMVNGTFYPDYLDNGEFLAGSPQVSAGSGSTVLPPPPKIWLRGMLWNQKAHAPTATEFVYESGSFMIGDTTVERELTLTRNNNTRFNLNGRDVLSVDDPSTEEVDEYSAYLFGGILKATGGVSLITSQQGAAFPACAVATQQRGEFTVPVFVIEPGGAPEGLPAGIRTGDNSNMVWLGQGPSGTGETVSWYGSLETPGVLQLSALDSASGTVLVTNKYWSTSTFEWDPSTIKTCLYKPARNLFGLPPGPLESLMSMPVLPMLPAEDNRVEQAAGLPADLPGSFIVQGAMWRFTGMQTGVDGVSRAIYEGYYSGQVIRISPPGENGAPREAIYENPADNNGSGAVLAGMFNGLRGSIRLRDGRFLFSGNDQGTQTATTRDDNKLHTIAADLDLTGNFFTMGSMKRDASRSGATFQFEDASDGSDPYPPVTLHSVLASPNAQWKWWRAGLVTNAQMVMSLDAFGSLRLYQPAADETGVEAGADVTLRTTGPSKFIRGILVQPGGDLPMNFTNGPQPGDPD